jgi:serine/threonine protein kinase
LNSNVSAIPSEPIPLSLKDFEIISKIGSGTNGTVYKTKLLVPHDFGTNDEYFAIKTISLERKSKDTVKEDFILKNITHPNIIKCHASFVEDNYLYIVMEYAQDGDLLSLIKKQKQAKRFFSEQTLWNYAWQL